MLPVLRAALLLFCLSIPGFAEAPATGNKVYLAGRMFKLGEKDFNLEIHLLEEFGYEVFLAQRDDIEAANWKARQRKNSSG